MVVVKLFKYGKRFRFAPSFNNLYLTADFIFLTSALDPAGPLFEDYEKDVRIDATDANYVDVIHTDGDNFGKF